MLTAPYRMKRLRFIVTSILCITICLTQNAIASNASNANTLRILDLESSGDPIGKYVTDVLRLALKKSGANYAIPKVPSVSTPQVRLIEDLARNRGELDIMWTMTSDEREAQLLPIRFPIDKGLMGWRIAFIQSDMQERLSAVKSIKDLSQLKAGQGYFWPDTTILRHNGLQVVTGTAAALPSMLSEKRFDYFPRSIIEIWNEKTNHPEFDREIETSIILHYPTALYFFVSPERKKLAEEIQRGLENALNDGSFEQLFNQYCKPFIQKANIKSRKILELKNPLIKQDSLPINRPELWFMPQTER